jgi:predicted PurR-regulated permease PerM
LAVLPTVLFVLLQLSLGGFIWTSVSYLLINMIMGNIVEPKVMGKGLGLSTLVVFISLIVRGFLLGIAGVFLSVHITIAIKILLEQNKKNRRIAILSGSIKETKHLQQMVHQ